MRNSAYQLSIAMLAFGTTADAAPPFNCSIAAEPAEIAICDSAELGLYDRSMNKLYVDKRVALKAAGRLDEWEQLRLEQRAFLKTRNACGYEVPCLTELYKKRNDELGKPMPGQAAAPASASVSATSP
jgi:uncharacterized protein